MLSVGCTNWVKIEEDQITYLSIFLINEAARFLKLLLLL